MQDPISEQVFSSCGLSHTGKVRDHNEDTFLDLNSEGLWVIADGAGGHKKGEVASQLIVDELSAFKNQDDLRETITWIIERLRYVNQQLIDMRNYLTGGELIASTVCVLFFQDKHCICIWSGDSRIYLYRDNKLFQLTQDHNRKEEFLHAGFSVNELDNYANANQLTKAVGAMAPLGIDVQLYEYTEDDIFLLCSDGLSGELDNHQIKKHIQKNTTAKTIAENLISSVLKQRARDNVTVVIIKP